MLCVTRSRHTSGEQVIETAGRGRYFLCARAELHTYPASAEGPSLNAFVRAGGCRSAGWCRVANLGRRSLWEGSGASMCGFQIGMTAATMCGWIDEGTADLPSEAASS